MANVAINSLSEFRKKVSITYEFIAAAHHEAGHVVYGLLKGFKIESVSIYEHKKYKKIEGITNSLIPQIRNIDDINAKQNLAISEICYNYAGLVAEKYHFKQISGSDKFPLFLRNGSSEDTLTSAAIIRQHLDIPTGYKRYEYKKKLISKTQREIKKHWNIVLLVAHELFRKKELSYLDLKELIINGSKDKKFWKKQFSDIEKVFEGTLVDENLFRITFCL